MPTLKDWWEDFWGTVQHSPTILPTRHAILHDHTDKQPGQGFRRDEHYFEVRVNRIFLKYSRDYWTTYAPMALIVSEFNYNGKDTVVPFIVGPSLLEKDKIELPNGFVFSDTKVAGIHAYKGDGLKLSVILYQVKRTDLAKKLLKVIENVASVVNFSQALGTYLKIAEVLVDTVGEVIGTDKDNKPIIGLRKEFKGADDFKAGYFALIDSPSGTIEQSKLWVRQNELLYGDDVKSAKEFTKANFVLYSIGQTVERDDFDKLPFYDQWKVALAESWTKEPEKWESAKANWTSLCQMMSLSPDLITPHADTLADQCFARMKINHEKVMKTATMAKGGKGETDMIEDPELQGITARLDYVRSKSLSIVHSK